mmetsp:Transcript_74701/g.215817  ORF Transcript_74701/g.215817 Transcript_74701/m.215817 type:complete len:671 (+) Transcript_74701:832-2844(+)
MLRKQQSPACAVLRGGRLLRAHLGARCAHPRPYTMVLLRGEEWQAGPYHPLQDHQHVEGEVLVPRWYAAARVVGNEDSRGGGPRFRRGWRNGRTICADVGRPGLQIVGARRRACTLLPDAAPWRNPRLRLRRVHLGVRLCVWPRARRLRRRRRVLRHVLAVHILNVAAELAGDRAGSSDRLLVQAPLPLRHIGRRQVRPLGDFKLGRVQAAQEGGRRERSGAPRGKQRELDRARLDRFPSVAGPRGAGASQSLHLADRAHVEPGRCHLWQLSVRPVRRGFEPPVEKAERGSAWARLHVEALDRPLKAEIRLVSVLGLAWALAEARLVLLCLRAVRRERLPALHGPHVPEVVEPAHARVRAGQLPVACREGQARNRTSCRGQGLGLDRDLHHRGLLLRGVRSAGCKGRRRGRRPEGRFQGAPRIEGLRQGQRRRRLHFGGGGSLRVGFGFASVESRRRGRPEHCGGGGPLHQPEIGDLRGQHGEGAAAAPQLERGRASLRGGRRAQGHFLQELQVVAADTCSHRPGEHSCRTQRSRLRVLHAERFRFGRGRARLPGHRAEGFIGQQRRGGGRARRGGVIDAGARQIGRWRRPAASGLMRQYPARRRRPPGGFSTGAAMEQPRSHRAPFRAPRRQRWLRRRRRQPRRGRCCQGASVLRRRRGQGGGAGGGAL